MLKDILGQASITNKFMTAWRQDRLGQGYILAGPDGLGKTPYAIELAKTFLCERGEEDACEKCTSCHKVQHGNHEDIEIMEAGGRGSVIKIDQVRELTERLHYRARANERRFVIIREVDKMGEEAANSFLKILEEPPPLVTFFLLTARLAAMLPTIISRCQVVKMHRATAEEIESFLIARAFSPDKAALYSFLADGCPGKAVAMEDAGMYERRALVLERILHLNGSSDAVIAADMIAANKAKTPAATRANHYDDLGLMAVIYRDMAIMADGGASALLYNRDVAEVLIDRARKTGSERLWRLTLDILKARKQIEQNITPDFVISRLFLDLAG